MLLGAFAVWEARNPRRFFPVAILRSPCSWPRCASGSSTTLGNAAAFLQLMNLWQHVNGLPTSEVAVWQLALLFAGIASGVVAGRVISKGVSNRATGVVGGILSALGLALLAIAHDSTTLGPFLPGMILGGAGVVVAAVAFGNRVLREAPPECLGPVSSSRTTFGQFAYTVGFALSTVMIDRLTVGGTTARLEAAGVPANQLATGLDAVTAYAGQGTRPDTALGQQALAAASGSYGTAFQTTMLVVAGLVVVASGLAWWLLRHGDGEPQPPHPEGTVLAHTPT